MGVIVRQKAKGKGNPWWVFINYHGHRRSMKVGSKASAQTVADKVMERLAVEGVGAFEVEEEIPTFEEYSERYMKKYSHVNHKESTQDAIRSTLKHHLLPCFGKKPLDTITKKDVKDFIYQKLNEELASSTVRNLKVYLSGILTEAVDDEVISSNPVSRTGKLIKKGTENGEEADPLTREEVPLFEEAVQKYYPKYYPLFLTFLRTGLRVGELVGLQPGDLDFQGEFISVRRSYSKGRLTTPKSGKSRRVDMSKGLAEVLRVYITERKREALAKGWGEPSEWLFYSVQGKMINAENLRKRDFHKILEKAGLRRITLKDLRHTYATLRIMKGDNIVDVSKQLGHHSVKLTLDTYTHWNPGSKKAEIDELDDIGNPIRTLYAPTLGGGEKREVI